MSQKYLGDTLDIHGGGLENQFPHHECEIAQGESLSGKPFVRYWVHHNMVTVDGVKMGKSLGNFKTVEDLLAKHSPEAIRAFILSTHYRSPTNYSEEAIQASTTGLTRLSQLKAALCRQIQGNAGIPDLDAEIDKLCREADQAIGEDLDNDLNTPNAIAQLYTFASSVNRVMAGNSLTPTAAKKALDLLDKWGENVLGIVGNSAPTGGQVDISPLMDIIVDLRKEMKASKRYDLADKIRDQLKAAGLQIEDTKAGARWRKL